MSNFKRLCLSSRLRSTVIISIIPLDWTNKGIEEDELLKNQDQLFKANSIDCEHLNPGGSGGYRQITQMIADGKVDIVIFLRDHRVVQPHHEDIRLLLETCNVHNIPLATNYASAELLILGLIRKEASERVKQKE